MKKGSNIVEYTLLFLLAGFVIGYALWNISPDTLKGYFKSSFGDTSEEQETLTIKPMGE